MIWIWGPSGIGKTTIARFLFNQISSHFQNSAFMEDIKGSYPKPCFDEYNAKLQLQNKMLSKMINHKDIMIPHLGTAQERLRNRKVLLVLDDVDRLAQLNALAGNVQWFGPGSRIIITTEDLRLLEAHLININHIYKVNFPSTDEAHLININHIYKVNFPSTDEALQMFCMYAFHQKSPKNGFNVFAREITYLVGELPLGLKVMGSYFCGLSKEQWSMEVSRLRTNLNRDIESILTFSYDALCDEDKDLFLHIACFFNKQYKWIVEEVLAERFKDLRQGLLVLEKLSLISIEGTDKNSYIKMHNLLAQLGKEIVRKESVREPGQRQFLIDDKDICQVLTSGLTGYATITGSVVGIDSEYVLDITDKEAFKGMSNLQFLRVRYNVVDHQNIISSPGPLTFITQKLRLLDWWDFPMTCLSFTNNLEFLVELRMRYSKLEKLWDGTKLLRNLKRMDLSCSINLKELPNLSTASNLKELELKGCSSLVELPSFIGNATNLEVLSLSGCSSLVKLPSCIGNATNLNRLELERCSSLVELPSFIGNANNLYKLDLEGCSSLVELPSSISNLTFLQFLKLNGCSSLVELPYSIRNLTKLTKILLEGCSSLVSLPRLPFFLSDLDAENCKSLEKLDCSFCNLGIRLNFINCFNLNKEARDLIIQTTSTHECVVLPGKEVPTCFTYRASGYSVTVKLNQKRLHPSTNFFKACILVVNKRENEDFEFGYKKYMMSVSCSITSKQNALTALRSYNRNLYPIRAEHLYIFHFEAHRSHIRNLSAVASTELVFTFELGTSWEMSFLQEILEIKECGILC